MPKRKKLRPDDFPNLHANHRGRMRSRILRNGASSLEPHELLETLLYLPVARQNTNHTAHMLVEKYNSVELALRRPAEELMQIPGVGEQSAQFLRDIGRVIEAYAQSKRRGRTVLEDSALARRLTLGFFAKNPDAECVLFSLDEALRILALTPLPRNPSTQTLIQAAAKFRASRAVIALRSDGDSEEPEHGEKATFETLCTVFSLLNVVFVDFLIVGDKGCRSYLERERLVTCTRYGEDSELNESSLHFSGGRKAVRFGGDDFDADAVAAFASVDADDSFSDAEIDPEEIYETVVEPLGTVGQMNEAEADGTPDVQPFGDLFDGAEADEEPF